MMMRSTGFTLLEVLVAIAITALVAVMAYGAFSSAMDAGDHNTARAEQLNELDSALRIVERDLAQAISRGIAGSYGEWEPAFQGITEGGLNAGRNGIDNYALQFTRDGWSNPLQQQRSELQRVGYRLQDGTLWRDHWQHLDLVQAEEPRRLPLLSGIVSMRLRFLGVATGEKNALGGQWLEQWPATTAADRASEQLPVAVEWVMELEEWGEIRRLFPLPENP